jgi:branched-chain amino acid transport system substrate-binding protein
MAAALIAAAGAVSDLAADAGAQERIKIGVASSLTGEAANYGADVRDFVRFANEELAGGKYELIIEDDKCSGKDAVTTAHKLIEVDKVSAVIGYACSSAALAAAPLHEKAKVPLMVVSASSPKLNHAGAFIFRTTPSDLRAAETLFAHAVSKHKRFGIISEETDYAQDIKNAFIGANKENRMRIAVQDFISGTSDFRTMLIKLKLAGVEGLFINTQTEPGFANILRQLKELRWEVPIYGAYWPGTAAFLKLAGKDAEGIEFITTPTLSDILGEEGLRLYARYRAKYGEIRSIESIMATAFEGFRALHLALESGRDVREYLASAKFSGIFGPYHFDREGQIVGLSFIMKRIINGKVASLP